ncbi:MAG: hypothetical protein AAGA66_14455 [Bacteroidota bacterium]
MNTTVRIATRRRVFASILKTMYYVPSYVRTTTLRISSVIAGLKQSVSNH